MNHLGTKMIETERLLLDVYKRQEQGRERDFGRMITKVNIMDLGL